MKVETSTLIGPALDWASAKANGKRVWVLSNYTPRECALGIRRYRITLDTEVGEKYQETHSPSTDWALGGPIIQRERITLAALDVGVRENWYADMTDDNDDCVHGRHGPTPLIAAMRCFVASKLGDEVDIPDQLCQ